jgi:lysozyme family protein
MNAIQSALAAKYAKAVVRPAHQKEIVRIIDMIMANQSRYEAVSTRLPSIPWWAVAVIHNMECDLNFHQHLHNGDSLSARTHNVPAGRPKIGDPPYEWEYSAADALTYDGLDRVTDWSIGVALDTFEKFNGVGDRKRNVPTPYLWSFTDQYISGKFVKDNMFDRNAVSEQAGIAGLLKELEHRALVKF